MSSLLFCSYMRSIHFLFKSFGSFPSMLLTILVFCKSESLPRNYISRDYFFQDKDINELYQTFVFVILDLLEIFDICKNYVNHFSFNPILFVQPFPHFNKIVHVSNPNFCIFRKRNSECITFSCVLVYEGHYLRLETFLELRPVPGFAIENWKLFFSRCVDGCLAVV